MKHCHTLANLIGLLLVGCIAATLPTTAPVTPAPTMGVGIAATGPASVVLSWATSRNQTAYEVQRSTRNGPTWTTLATPAGTATSWTDTTAAPATTYSYRVRATNGAAASVWSAYASVTTPTATAVAQPASVTTKVPPITPPPTTAPAPIVLTMGVGLGATTAGAYTIAQQAPYAVVHVDARAGTTCDDAVLIDFGDAHHRRTRPIRATPPTRTGRRPGTTTVCTAALALTSTAWPAPTP